MGTDPITLFSTWLNQARRHVGIIEPTAACLATAGKDGRPSARIVLIKQADAEGFVFYTNMDSRKGQELKDNPKAALCFYWMPLRRQVRVEGIVEQVSDAEADAYFATRPRESQIGAWASKQSQRLEDRDELLKAAAATQDRFENQPVPRPPFWSGWRLVPDAIEFWQQGDFRLHERELYIKKAQRWEMEILYP